MRLQVGIRSAIRERRSRHERTCFWQSTEVTPAFAKWVVVEVTVGQDMLICLYVKIGKLGLWVVGNGSGLYR